MSRVKFAPVMVVSGGVDFLRHRFVQQVVTAAKKEGRRFVTIEPGDEEGLRDVLSGGILFTDALVVVVESAKQQKARKKKTPSSEEEALGTWSEEALALVLDHAKGDGDSLVLIVHHVGDAGAETFAGQVSAKIPKGQSKVFPSPKPWEAQEYSTKFLSGELRRLGKTISDSLAEQIVQKVGTDVGLLSFEALKISMCLDVDGRTEAQASDVSPVIAALGSEDWDALTDALGTRNGPRTLRAWTAVRERSSSDTFQRYATRLSVLVTNWLFASVLLEQGMTAEEAAARAGVHPYRYKVAWLAPAQRWGRPSLETFLRSLVKINAAKGHVNPWVALESTIAAACDVVR